MTLEDLDRWLDGYGRAWERFDRDGFVGCFTDEATYAWGPWTEPLRGHEAIGARFDEAVADQADVRFGHEPLAVTPDGRGLARWWVAMAIPAHEITVELEGIFLVTLDATGKCTEFREWWNERTTPAHP